MSYKTLGDYIQPVNNRNRPLVTNDLRGLSMRKEFRKSTSNIVGVDLTKYKLITKNQFACDFMSVIRVHKLPVVLHSENEPVIVSPAYTVFEVKVETELLPEYLMMWFRRSEFDRYADFRCDSAVRGGFMWNELCDTQLPIPSIEKQQQIVAEYNTVTNRIHLNNQLNQNLEKTAQALYKHWFVDFEFPNTENKPYKSSGGLMVYNEELEKEIPVGWEVEKLESFTARVCVGFVGSLYDSYCKKSEGIPMLRTTDLTSKGMSYYELKYVTKEFHSKNLKSQLTKGDILVARHGTNGMPVIFDAEFEANCLNVIIIKPDNSKVSSKLIHCFLNSEDVKIQIQGSLRGSVQSVLNTSIISDLLFLNNKTTNNIISKKLKTLQTAIEVSRKDLFVLEKMKSLLLAKMTQQETKAQAV